MLTEFQMEYLNMNPEKEGQSVFGAATAFDWYVISKTDYNKPTEVVDYNGVKTSVDLASRKFLVNWNQELADDLFKAEPLFDDMQSRVCDNSKNTSVSVGGDFVIPVLRGVSKEGPRIEYTKFESKDKSYSGVAKVIVKAQRNSHCYNDAVGYFGISGSETAAIPVNSIKHGEVVCEFLRSKVWQDFHMAMNFVTFKIDRQLFRYVDWSEENLKGIMAKHG